MLQIQYKDRLESRPVIYQFVNENRPFSNFWPCDIILPAEKNLQPMHFGTVENAYMAAKTLNQAARNDIVRMTSGQAKRFSYTPDFPLRTDYSDAWRLQTMDMCINQKFGPQNPEMLALALQHPTTLFIEGNVHCDTFYGMNLQEGYGQNHLGRLITKRCQVVQALYL